MSRIQDPRKANNSPTPCCHRAHFAVLSRRHFFSFVSGATIYEFRICQGEKATTESEHTLRKQGCHVSLLKQLSTTVKALITARKYDACCVCAVAALHHFVVPRATPLETHVNQIRVTPRNGSTPAVNLHELSHMAPHRDLRL